MDIGVHQDGMIHVSELGDNYVKNVQNQFSAGSILKVRVLDFDIEKKRISLSLRQPGSKSSGRPAKKAHFKAKRKPVATLSSLKKKFSGAVKQKQNNVKLKFSVKSIMKSGR